MALGEVVSSPPLRGAKKWTRHRRIHRQGRQAVPHEWATLAPTRAALASLLLLQKEGVMTLAPPPSDPSGHDRQRYLLTPRNLLILMVADVGAQHCIPVVLPKVAAGSPPSLVAFLGMAAALDRIVGL
jgi:hypothetical protein